MCETTPKCEMRHPPDLPHGYHTCYACKEVVIFDICRFYEGTCDNHTASETHAKKFSPGHICDPIVAYAQRLQKEQEICAKWEICAK